MTIPMKRKISNWQRAKKFGIDTTLLEINLKRTPTERVIALQNLLAFTNALAETGRAYYAKLRKDR